MKKINIALIGTGFIAHYHARAILSLSDTRISVICDTNRASAEKFADKYHLKCPIATDPVQMLNTADVDAAVIAIPNKYHLPYARKLLTHGKDVLIEKPLALNSAEAEEIMRTAETSGRVVMTGHMWRFDEEVNFIKKGIAAGKIGTVFKTKGFGIHENWGPEGWFTQKELAGGGALIDMGVHALDTARYLLGDPDPDAVYAQLGTYFGNYDVDDSGILVVTWSNGAVSVIESGWWHPHADGPEAATRLFGTRGYASLFPTFLKTSDGIQETFTPSGPPKTEHCDQSIYTKQMAHFMSRIRTHNKGGSVKDPGEIVMNIVSAAYRSAADKQVIQL